MKLTIFQSDKGDCILITSKDGKHILADGGMYSSYKDHVRTSLGELHQQNKVIDLVYVSHIDQDHIAGIVQLMNDTVDWKVHKYQIANGNPNHSEPDFPEPPEIKEIWHNSFHEQVGKNAGPIEEMLAANISLFSTSQEKWALDMAEKFQNLTTSKAEAHRLSRRIGPRQLNIPLNSEYGGKLMCVADPIKLINLGSLDICVIGPFTKDLKVLRKEWNNWLKSQAGRKTIRKIRAEALRDEDKLDWNDFDRFIKPMLMQADELGNREKVTPPNLASLMLLIEEDGKTVLMTGDGHWKDILNGLEANGKLDANKNCHVNVLKVQHHGSEHNSSLEFCQRVTADHYIFCGNGSDENPDLKVVQTYINSRIGSASQRSNNIQVNNPFKMWFNSKSTIVDDEYSGHMKQLENLVKDKAQSSNGQMTYKFLQNSSFEISLT